MAVSRVSLSSITQGFPKSRSFLDGNSAYIPSSFESIATATAAGGETSLSFTSISGSYKSLQIRGISREVTNSGGAISYLRLNSDTGSNYVHHVLYGDGSTAGAGSGTAQTRMQICGQSADASLTSNVFSVYTIDLIDYANTSKNKTIKTFSGTDSNGVGTVRVSLYSGLWLSTSAITGVSLIPYGAGGWAAGTTFALYGIKG